MSSPGGVPSPQPGSAGTDHMSAELSGLLEQANTHAANAVADNTRRAYRSDWANFTTWCDHHHLEALPADSTTVVLYLTDQARTLKMSTIGRRLSSISMAHRSAGHPSPAEMLEVKRVMQGLRRGYGTAPTKKTPLRIAEIRRLVTAVDNTTTAGMRDRALILMGFAGALRRSELTALDTGSLEDHENGLIVTISRSKTDQEAAGRRIGIPYGSNPTTCPIRATRTWLNHTAITNGPLWRPVTRHGHISNTRLTAQSIALIIKRTCHQAGLNPDHYAAHSLRSGFATTAAEAGATERAITRQTGHTTLPTLRGYIHEGTLFTNNAATQLGL